MIDVILIKSTLKRYAQTHLLCPESHLESTKLAIFEAGAGGIGIMNTVHGRFWVQGSLNL
jgi:hypothetical protein